MTRLPSMMYQIVLLVMGCFEWGNGLERFGFVSCTVYIADMQFLLKCPLAVILSNLDIFLEFCNNGFGNDLVMLMVVYN